MKFLMLIVLSVGAALLSVWALPLLTEGLVVVRFAGWYVELRVIVALALIILLCLGLWGVVWLWRLPGNVVRTWVEKRAQAQLELGMLALSEGDFAKAEKALTKSAPHSKTPSLNYLAAAQAAQGKGKESSRDKYLDRADSTPKAKRPVQLTRAELLIASGDLASAREILEALDDKSNRPRVLGLLARCYRNQEDWHALGQLAPRLKKAQVVDEEAADELERRGYKHGLATAEQWSELDSRWSELPKPLRAAPDMLAAYGKAAASLDKGSEVELLLRKTLRKNWSDEVASVWSELPSATPDKRRKQLQTWLKDLADNAIVQYAAGQDCAAQQQWDEAVTHFERSLDLDATARASEALGNARERSGDITAAAQAYKRALALAAGRDPEPLMLPEAAPEEDQPEASDQAEEPDAQFDEASPETDQGSSDEDANDDTPRHPAN